MSAPGPHVLLLIQHPDLTEKNRYMLEFMNNLSEDTIKHTIVLLMSQMKCSSTKENEAIPSLNREGWMYYELKNKGRNSMVELFQKIKTLDTVEKGKHLTLETYKSLPDMPSISFEQLHYETKKMETAEQRGKGQLSSLNKS